MLEIFLRGRYVCPLFISWATFDSLTLIGMRGDTFISLSFLDQILSVEFFIKNFQPILEVKIDINWINLTPCQAL